MYESKYNVYGVYEGVVIDNYDFDQTNRLQVRIPVIHGSGTASKVVSDLLLGVSDDQLPWAHFCVPFYPMSFVPPIGTVVFVSFINGVVDRPVVIGCRANYRTLPNDSPLGSDIPSDSKDVLPTDKKYERVKAFQTEKFTVYFDDENNLMKIYSGSDYIELDAANHVLNLNGDSAHMSSLVLGEKLTTLFNNHVHPTGVGPSGTAMEGGTFLVSPMDNSASASYPHLTHKAKTGP